MDLPAEARRLALDLLAVELGAALADAGVPYALLKGPSTALWLYDPPRSYRDVDLLIPASARRRAVSALKQRGLAEPGAGRAGDEAPHSLLLRTGAGVEVDLHLTLPTLSARDDSVWAVLAPHVTGLDLTVGSVRALDEPARCLVVALHALNSGPGSGQPEEDLQRALDTADHQAWDEARQLAAAVHAADLFDGALAMVRGRPDEAPARARLFAEHAPAAALGLDRLLRTPARKIPAAILRELFPRPGFFRYEQPSAPRTLRWLVGAYARRWWRLAGALPSALRRVVAARRQREPARASVEEHTGRRD